MQLSGWMGRSVAVAILIGIGGAAWFMLVRAPDRVFFRAQGIYRSFAGNAGQI